MTILDSFSTLGVVAVALLLMFLVGLIAGGLHVGVLAIRRRLLGPVLVRRELARMARERKAADRIMAYPRVAASENYPRTPQRRYRVRAREFHGTTQISLVATKGSSGEEDSD